MPNNNLRFKFGRGLVVVVVLNLLGGVATGAAAMMIRAELSALSGEYRARREAAERAANAQAIAEMHAAVSAEARLFDRHLINQESLPNLIEGIEELSRTSGVDLEFSSFEETPTAGDLNLILKVRGRYSSIVRFAELLANAPLVLRFERIALAEDRPDFWTSDLAIVVISFDPAVENSWSLYYANDEE